MKTVKIILVTVFVAALIFGAYKIFSQSSDGDGGGVIKRLPPGWEWVEHYIDSTYCSIPNGNFKFLSQRRKEMTDNLEDMMADAPTKTRETVNLILRNRYQTRFIQMANFEFAKKTWPHYADMLSISSTLLVELSQGSQDLVKIKNDCSKYKEVVIYNSNVKKQCEQSPANWKDRWNYDNTKHLLGSTPTANAPVNHTDPYDLSRPEKVKKRLYEGHTAFLNALVDCAHDEIENNPTPRHYNDVFDSVSKEIDLFEEKASSLYARDGKSLSVRLLNQLKEYEKLVSDEKD